MTILKQGDSKKWIQGLVVITSVIAAYVSAAFFHQAGEWLDLEAKVSYLNGIIQAFSVVVGFAVYFFIMKSKEAYLYLDEVYNELVKVIWPDRESTLKLTIGIIIGIIITSIVLGIVDFGISKVFRLLYN